MSYKILLIFCQCQVPVLTDSSSSLFVSILKCRFMEIDLGEIRKDVQCPICLGTSTPMLLLSFSFDFAENMFFKFLESY